MTQHVAHRHSDEIHELRAEIERLRSEKEAVMLAKNEQEIVDAIVKAAEALEQIANILNAVIGKDDHGKRFIRMMDIDRARDPT